MPDNETLKRANQAVLDIKDRVDTAKKLIYRQARVGMDTQKLQTDLKASEETLGEKVRERNNIIVAIRKRQPLR